MLNFLIGIFTKTIGKLDLPFAIKKFDLNDFPLIEEKINRLPFVIILVTTYGLGSNILIRIGQWFGIHKWTNKTHVVLSIGGGLAVEASGSEGIRQTTLLKAIGQRDEVKILFPLHPPKVSIHARDYLKKVVELDNKKPILYDNEHNIDDVSSYDCSEVFFHAFNFGLSKEGLRLLKPVKRAGKNTYAPIDVEFCRLLYTVYDSNKGFI